MTPVMDGVLVWGRSVKMPVTHPYFPKSTTRATAGYRVTHTGVCPGTPIQARRADPCTGHLSVPSSWAKNRPHVRECGRSFSR
jgi:hypothetical protein